MTRLSCASCDRARYGENRVLRGVLQSLANDATHNQQALQRFHERELALLSAADLAGVLSCLTDGMRSSFGLDSVKLKLLDPCHVIADLLSSAHAPDGELMRDVELCTDVAATRARFHQPEQLWLGAWNERRHLPLFSRRLDGSVALIPLRHSEGLVGYLCLGSRDPQRFDAHRAVDFLDHLALVAAVCVENAVNRERLRLVGLTDPLTGLYNRRHLEHRLAQEVSRARRYRQELACLFVDADHFKRINDTHGHAVGDQVLAALAARLSARLRASDVATRYGGEEFAVLLPQTDIGSARALGEEICHAIAAQAIELPSGLKLSLSVSIGVAALRRSDDTADSPAQAMLKAADAAVYAAKQAGRNRVMCAHWRESSHSHWFTTDGDAGQLAERELTAASRAYENINIS